MGDFEVLEPASNGQELIELAHEAEAYINSHTRKQRQRTKRTVDDLNFAASEILLQKSVQLSGSLLIAAPFKTREDPDAMITVAAYGNVTGTSLGFRAIDLYQLLDELAPRQDADGLDILGILRERAYGRLAICHAISYRSNEKKKESDNCLTLTTETTDYRALGPISSSYLFANDDYNALPAAARHREVAKIIDLMDAKKQMQVSEICIALMEGDDAVTSFATTAEVAKELFTAANPIERNALLDLINTYVRLSSALKRVSFTEGMPVCLFPLGDEEGNCDIDKPQGLTFFHIESIDMAPHYEDVSEGDVQPDNNTMQLFMKGDLMDIVGSSSRVLIPAQYVANYPYQAIQEL